MVCALHASMYLSLSSCLGSACGRLRWPKAVVIDVVEIVSVNVVKITFWLVKSYDFTSQNMHYVLNRLKKSKMGKIGLKSGEIAKIGWNRAKSRFQDRFCDFAKMRRWNKIPPSCPAVRRLLDFSCTITDSRDCLQSSLQVKILTIHKSIFTNHNAQNTLSNRTNP